MDMRRRQLRVGGETADDRLDRLIQMEEKARAGRSQTPEVKRLKVVEGDLALVGADGARGSGDGVRVEPEAIADPVVLQLQDGPDVPAPDGLLVPLFSDLSGDGGPQRVQPRRLDLGDGVGPPRPLSLENLGREPGLLPGHGRQVDAERAVVPVNRDGMGQVREAGGTFSHAPWAANSQVVLPGGVNPFWSPEVRHRAMVEQAVEVARPDGLPPMAGPPTSYGPVQALGVVPQQALVGTSGPGQAAPTMSSSLVQAAGTTIAGPVQASGSMFSSPGNAAGPMASGPVQASTTMVAGPGQTHGELCPGWVHVQSPGTKASPEQALAGVPGVHVQASPEREVEALRLKMMREMEEKLPKRGEEASR